MYAYIQAHTHIHRKKYNIYIYIYVLSIDNYLHTSPATRLQYLMCICIITYVREFSSEREAEARTTERRQMSPYPVCSCKYDVASCRYVCMYVPMLGPLADL